MAESSGGSWGPEDNMSIDWMNILKNTPIGMAAQGVEFITDPLVAGVAHELDMDDKVSPRAKNRLKAGTRKAEDSFFKAPRVSDSSFNQNTDLKSPFGNWEASGLSYANELDAPVAVVPASPKAKVKSKAKSKPVAKPVPIKAAPVERYATVDPLNLFGNRNGVNPFARDGRPMFSNSRFSGGVVSPTLDERTISAF